MASKEYVIELYSLCDSITQTPVPRLVKTPEMGNLNFADEDWERDLTRAFDALRDLRALPIHILLHVLPQEELDSIIKAATRLWEVIRVMRHFSVADGHNIAYRDKIKRSITLAIGNLFRVGKANQHTASFVFQSGDAQRNLDQINSALGTILRAQEEAEKGAAAVKVASGEVGVDAFSKVFKEEAERLEMSARKWLCAAGLIGGGTVGQALWLFHSGDPSGWHVVARDTSTRLVALGVSFYAAVWCARNYRTLMHQATTNRHHALALHTFKALMEAAAEEKTKDAVLMETVKSIFGGATSGYLGKGYTGSNGSQSMNIIEVVKEAIGPTKK